MYEKITKKLVKECINALEFYDENGCLPWEKKRINIMISAEKLKQLEGKNKSQLIENALNNYPKNSPIIYKQLFLS